MSADGAHDHLSRITTMWTVVENLHGDEADVMTEAQQQMIERYSGAVYRYLVSLLRNRNAADEVFQEFAMRLIKGGFRNADRERGRFRDYVKTAVLRLVTDYYRSRKRRDPLNHAVNAVEGIPVRSQENEPADGFDAAFLESCRDELLSRAWLGLKLIEDTQGQPYHTVLDLRARNPHMDSAEMAATLTQQLNSPTPLRPTAIRKTLQRAREKFSELLLYEVGQSANLTSPDDIEAELIELGLHPYCLTPLRKRRGDAQQA